jgi:hypothetical protein
MCGFANSLRAMPAVPAHLHRTICIFPQWYECGKWQEAADDVPLQRTATGAVASDDDDKEDSGAASVDNNDEDDDDRGRSTSSDVLTRTVDRICEEIGIETLRRNTEH